MIEILIVIGTVDRNSDHGRKRDHDQKPTLITQENQTELEGLRKENAKLREEKEQARIAKSKLEKKKEDKVLAEHLAIDAAKAKLKSDSNPCASKLIDQFGPGVSSKKDVGTRPKISQKGASKSDSPAKGRVKKKHVFLSTFCG